MNVCLNKTMKKRFPLCQTHRPIGHILLKTMFLKSRLTYRRKVVNLWYQTPAKPISCKYLIHIGRLFLYQDVRQSLGGSADINYRLLITTTHFALQIVKQVKYVLLAKLLKTNTIADEGYLSLNARIVFNWSIRIAFWTCIKLYLNKPILKL